MQAMQEDPNISEVTAKVHGGWSVGRAADSYTDPLSARSILKLGRFDPVGLYRLAQLEVEQPEALLRAIFPLVDVYAARLAADATADKAAKAMCGTIDYIRRVLLAGLPILQRKLSYFGVSVCYDMIAQ